MGIDMELEFEKYCVVGGSPKTVLPSSRRLSEVEKRGTKGRLKCGYHKPRLKEDFTDISFYLHHSASNRGIPSKASLLEGTDVLKRSVAYHSFNEARKKNNESVEGRRKIELSQSCATAFSFGIIDSLCSSDEDSSPVEQKRPLLMSANSDLSATSVTKTKVKLPSEDCWDFPEGNVLLGAHWDICPDSVSRKNQSAENVETLPSEDPRPICDLSASPLNDGDVVRERDPVAALQKSLSAKLVPPHSLAQSESDCSKASSPKARFSPIRRMFDPIIKSKSQKSPLGSTVGTGKLTPAELVGLSRNRTFWKSPLQNLSNRAQNVEFHSPSIKKEHYNPIPPCSLAHLRGFLKLQNKHGVPFFEFSVEFPEDVFVAKIWKVEDALNWVYTFHCIQNRRKSSAFGWGLKESSRASSMVGQMQVSCHFCAELKDAGVFDNSMVTKFVLYDIAHARKSVATVDNSKYSPDACEPPRFSNENSSEVIFELDEVSSEVKLKGQPKHAFDRDHLDLSTSHPLAAAELHPNFEIAAIIIQVPFGKRESLKCNSIGGKSDKSLSNLFDLSGDKQRKKDIHDCLGTAKVKVVTTCGNHSLPSIESRGPSPLLDRWRLGGGCDCGGWDMACPLTVLGNPDIRSAEVPLMESQCPLALFIQGRKDKTPALILNIVGEGQYVVDFHGQLTTLQAFSICVAILHATETSVSTGQERGKLSLQCSSLRVSVEEEVTEEEKRKVSKRMEEVLPSFVVNPPFSPIARV